MTIEVSSIITSFFSNFIWCLYLLNLLTCFIHQFCLIFYFIFCLCIMWFAKWLWPSDFCKICQKMGPVMWVPRFMTTMTYDWNSNPNCEHKSRSDYRCISLELHLKVSLGIGIYELDSYRCFMNLFKFSKSDRRINWIM